MHVEEFIADNMIKVGYPVISVDWRSADRSWYSEKEKSSFLLLLFFFVFLFFFDKSAYTNTFSGHMHNFFLL